MQDAYDPFSFLLEEIEAYDAGQRDWDQGLRDHYVGELRADEAEEIAWGRRHLTIVYGPGVDPRTEGLLYELIGGFARNLPSGSWHRVSGLNGHHVTISVGGPTSQAIVDLMVDILAKSNPGTWRLLDTAVVVPAR